MGRPKSNRAVAMTQQVMLSEPTEERVETPKKTYAPTDLVKCRSIYSGYMNFGGPKTKTTYQWSNSGDTEFVEYQDLRAAMLARSPHVYDPKFIIEDDDVLEGEEWARVRALYESLYSKKDLKEILSYPPDKMRKVIEGLPAATQRSIANIAKTMMDTGELDSLKRITIIDELLGTDLKLFMG